MDYLGHLSPHLHTESQSNVNHCPIFYLKACLHHIEPFRKTLNGHKVYSWFLGIDSTSLYLLRQVLIGLGNCGHCKGAYDCGYFSRCCGVFGLHG